MRESKEERFRRLAEARVNKIIKMIRLLGNCSQTGVYAYTFDQVGQIFSVLQTELNHARERFIDTEKRAKKKFSLSDASAAQDNIARPRVYLDLPDGSVLRATAYQDDAYPTINIERITGVDEPTELVCFAEFNPERGDHGQLCIGTYQSNQEDTTYYEPYEVAERELPW